MTISMKMWGIVLVLMLVSGVSYGQNKNDEAAAQPAAQTEQGNGRHYQMVFVAREVEGGKVINSRRYETDMALQGPESGTGSIRTGSRIPICTAGCSVEPKPGAPPVQYTYADVAVNLDFKQARLEGDRVFLSITAEIKSVDAAVSDSLMHQAIVRQNTWNAGVTVPLSKPTVIFSSDDVSSKRTMQIELTVTPVR